MTSSTSILVIFFLWFLFSRKQVCLQKSHPTNISHYTVSETVSIDSHETFLASPFHYIVISAKQFDATIMNISSLDNEVFPLEEDLLNYTQHVIPALISIPPEVLLGRDCLDGELKECW